MFKRISIQERQVVLVSSRSGFEKILECGSHYLPLSKSVLYCELSDFPAKVPNLEWLASSRAAQISEHLDIVQTGIEDSAMVCLGPKCHFVPPNSLQAFWKKDLPIQILRSAIPTDLVVPAEWVAKLPIGVSVGSVKQVTIPAGAYGVLFVDDMFANFLLPGRHAYFDILPKTRLAICKQAQVHEAKDIVHALQASKHAAISEQLAAVEIGSTQIGLWWDEKQLVHVSPSAAQAYASKALRVELIELEQTPSSVPSHIAQAMRSSEGAARLLQPHVSSYEVPSEHIGMFHVDGVFNATLQPGFFAYWHGGKRLSLTMIDTRLTMLEITGQEMLTQDKVQLRVNVTAGYKIVDGRLAIASLSDYKDFIYKEIQFALRAAIGSRTLDGLLENKNETDEQILGYMRAKAAAQGIEMISLGIKDLILPGEIKTILGKVVEAEKAAQANVIRRREETAATRSLMNTAKVMEDNPVALRLKELETLEKITEKIDNLNVYGGLEGLLKQLVPFKPADKP